MVAPFVLVGTVSGKETAVVQAVRGVMGVVSVNAVTGPYDVIARVEAKDVQALGNTIITKIRPIAGVQSTLTCIVVS